MADLLAGCASNLFTYSRSKERRCIRSVMGDAEQLMSFSFHNYQKKSCFPTRFRAGSALCIAGAGCAAFAGLLIGSS